MAKPKVVGHRARLAFDGEGPRKIFETSFGLKSMDKVVEAAELVKKEWVEVYVKTLHHIKDGLALLRCLQFKLDLLAPQLPTHEDVQLAQSMLQSWKTQCQGLRLNLRNANLQAKDNMRKAAQKVREQLLGGGEESTIRRRNLRTKAGMTSAAESITASLRRTRQLMVQEVERSASTLTTFEESTGVLRKAETEYKGHRSLLMRTRNLLSTMQRQDVIDRLDGTSCSIYILILILYLFKTGKHVAQ
ncbi:uncharacterized protein LOC120006027 [Tripterygium wilfordii]|uniref:uncharacterized protein LOC120006027 n=1 Tax=Tripterygium wilfordii TaxID=458696 RepID=UPI0018F82066|nr:uncharacterized protein LOC120006027 [Tripterygium wilfordii]